MDSKQSNQPQQEIDDTIVSRLARHDRVPWYKKTNLRLMYLLMLPACMGAGVTAGFDASTIGGLQAVSSWVKYFHHPHSTLLGFIVAAYSLGYIVAIPFIPFAVDTIGRRYVILLAGITAIIGGIIQGSALNVKMFITARFILGFAGVSNIVAASLLIGELSHPNERLIMGCLISITHSLGAVIAASVTFGTFAMKNNWGWRIPSFCQAALGLLQVCFICFLPESPRWLISRGRKDEAYAVLVKYHAEGDDKSEFVKTEYAQIERTLKTEQKIAKRSWKELLSASGMRKRVAITTFLGLTSHWCGIGLTTAYLSPILDSIGIHDNRTKNIINISKVSWGFISSVLCVMMVPRYPRRRIFLACATSLSVTFVSWTVASAEYSITQSKISAQATLVFIFLCNVAFNLGYSAIIYAFLVELFPFHARAKGISIYHWWSCISEFTSNAINPIGMSAAGWKWYLVYCVWNALSIVFVYFMIPETSGRTLEELSFLYESDRKVIGPCEDEPL